MLSTVSVKMVQSAAVSISAVISHSAQGPATVCSDPPVHIPRFQQPPRLRYPAVSDVAGPSKRILAAASAGHVDSICLTEPSATAPAATSAERSRPMPPATGLLCCRGASRRVTLADQLLPQPPLIKQHADSSKQCCCPALS